MIGLLESRFIEILLEQTLLFDTSLILFSFPGPHVTKTNSHQENIFTLTTPKMGKKECMSEEQEVMQHTAFSKAFYDLTHSERVINDLTFGRRVGLYELRGEIGSGNFSQVRLGIHDLTKGEMLGFALLYFTIFTASVIQVVD